LYYNVCCKANNKLASNFATVENNAKNVSKRFLTLFQLTMIRIKVQILSV